MRHTITLIAAIALSIIPTMRLHAKDDNDHTLTSLWKTFYTARDNDRPKDEAEALGKIKKEALAKGLAWDYYDACQEYVDTRSRTNWKEYEKALAQFKAEIEANAAPVAVIFYRYNYDGGSNVTLEYIQEQKNRLLKDHNPEFYTRDYSLTGQKFSDPLLDIIQNDYEYALWTLCCHNNGNKRIVETVKSYFAGRYPFDAFLDYMLLSRESEKKAPREAFISKFDGKAATLLAEEDILVDRFHELQNNSKSGQDEYKVLNAGCDSFIRRRDSYTGSEKKIAQCCTVPDDISKMLNSKKAAFKISDGKLELLLRNLDEATVSIKPVEGKQPVAFERKFKDTARRFFVTDTIKVDLPALDDGDYTVTCRAAGIKDVSEDYSRHSLSMAWRSDGSGLAVFVADYLSGQPVEKADFILTDRSGKTVGEARGLHLDGFTDLPADIVKPLSQDRRGCNLQVSCRDAKGVLHSTFSQRVSLNANEDFTPDEESLRCLILTDRSAFNPEETVHFKGVLYQGYYKLKACGAGVAVKAVLRDAKGKEIASLDLKTDDFGSVAGEFFLERAKENGLYSIELKTGGKTLATRRIRVDDFVLPTFALTWDKDTEEFKPGDTVYVKGNIKSYSGHNLGAADITYSVRKYQEVKSGNLVTDKDGNFTIEFHSDPDDYWQSYQITVKAVDATGETKEFSRSLYIRRSSPSDEPKEYYFKQLEDGPLTLKAVAGDKPVWAVAELFGPGNRLLEKRLVRFAPADGAKATAIIKFDYKDAYPDVVSMNVLYFQNGDSYRHSLVARRPDDSWKLPVRFTRFLDTSAPGAKYTFTVKTEAGVQCAATIFDKSTETVMPNVWNTVAPALLPAPSIYYSSNTGRDYCHAYWYDEWIGYSGGSVKTRNSGRMMGKGTVLMAQANAPAPDVMVEKSAVFDTVEEVMDEEAVAVAEEAPADGYIRENFANTIAWEPCLASDKDGNISFTFTNADKLSTYYVQLFAHDRNMRNGTLRREMKVTLPVKIAVVEPQILRDGDRYIMKATLSNSTSSDVPGTVAIDFFGSGDWQNSKAFSSGLEKIIVPANGSASVQKEVSASGLKDLGIKLSFTPDDKAAGADGVFVCIPVLPAVQTITEAHSSLFFPGDDREALVARLRSEFVNFPGSEAALREISILDMLKEAIPERVEPKGENAVALTEALYAGMLAEGLNGRPMKVAPDSKILAKILKLQTSEGGFAWFDGMDASPIVTCLVLERFHRMGLTQGTDAAVRFIDDVFFRKNELPYWRGWISSAQYLYIRSLYPGVEFSTKGIDAKRWKEFRKATKAYLVPSGARGLNGRIFAKARRVETLRALLASPEGLRLASKWGIKLATGSKLEKSLAKDVESLSQYAEPHVSGGMYFPNAVMPFRGLLESELYAHSHLCRLMADMGHGDIADGVRLWLMVQKETQHWDTDPGYMEALHAVFEGSDELLATKVIALKGSVVLPFPEVKASGNGFTVERQYFKDGRRIADGEVLQVGDRITAVYKVWNGENRSFVKLTAPRPAALKPVQQLSGRQWNCWRNVLKDRTEYWYESYPKETTEVREDFYVQQAGSFLSPAIDIVCEYADHYRANDSGRPAMKIGL